MAKLTGGRTFFDQQMNFLNIWLWYICWTSCQNVKLSHFLVQLELCWKRKWWWVRRQRGSSGSQDLPRVEKEVESQNSDVAEIGRNILREFKGDFFRNEIKMMEIIYDSRQFFMENRIDRGLSLKIKNSSLPYFSSRLENTYIWWAVWVTC